MNRFGSFNPMSDDRVLCIPNISEGRDSSIIDGIVASLAAHDVKLLSVEPDADYNRTVITFAGRADDVSTAAFALIGSAVDRIDMSTHTGSHPRMGAVDVVPFVPVGSTAMEACVAMAQDGALRVATELGIPTFCYGAAASSDSRRNLAGLRRGQYEGLESRIVHGIHHDHDQATMLPDHPASGWSDLVRRTGAISFGARPPMIAYNVNLEGEDPTVAKRIAEIVRTSGRWITSSAGARFRTKGLLDAVQGMGVSLPSQGISQVSMNLHALETTSMHHVHGVITMLAEWMGSTVTGSELVGLVPLQALVDAGRWCSGDDTLDEEDCVAYAVTALGLDQLGPFNSMERIIEWTLEATS